MPNPETLDALGISRNWINNRGFGDSDLKTISMGSDIPDMNRDPSGFAAFKNKYFSNTIPIIPGTEPPAPNQSQEPNVPSNGQWQVGARIGLCAGAQIRTGSGFSYPTHTIVPDNNWKVDIIEGPTNKNGVIWWDISRKNIDGGGTGWVYFEQAGLCNGNNSNGEPPQSENDIGSLSPEDQPSPPPAEGDNQPSTNEAMPEEKYPFPPSTEESNQPLTNEPNLKEIENFIELMSKGKDLIDITGAPQFIPGLPLAALEIIYKVPKAINYENNCRASQDPQSLSCGRFALTTAEVLLVVAGIVSTSPVSVPLIAGGVVLYIVDKAYDLSEK